jgi:hypothetical protein
LYWVFLRQGLTDYFPGETLNHDPADLYLPGG